MTETNFDLVLALVQMGIVLLEAPVAAATEGCWRKLASTAGGSGASSGVAHGGSRWWKLLVPSDAGGS